MIHAYEPRRETTPCPDRCGSEYSDQLPFHACECCLKQSGCVECMRRCWSCAKRLCMGCQIVTEKGPACAACAAEMMARSAA